MTHKNWSLSKNTPMFTGEETINFKMWWLLHALTFSLDTFQLIQHTTIFSGDYLIKILSMFNEAKT